MDAAQVQALIVQALTWVGFALVSGLAAKAIMPGRDPGGAVVTLVLGIGGALLGVAVYMWFTGERIHNLISPMGFAVATAGSFFLLVTHRLLLGNRRHYRSRGDVIDEVIDHEPRYRRRRHVRYSDLD
ncbi:MAG: GlsB/YeaQ/YmgE family stress response membrane protein [Planctomycetales bacterium]|nr:GlsB/YeaQ/YmgE family stress response membrane protein [Planctomycetales bacterium]